MNCSSSYGTITHHRFLQDAIDEVENSAGIAADIIITGPLEVGEGSDIEDIDNDNLEDDIPKEWYCRSCKVA